MKREFGFEKADVRVKRFEVDETGMLIEPIPGHYVKFLDNPDFFTAHGDDWTDSVREWIEDGDFVLSYGNNYFLNAVGHVTSS